MLLATECNRGCAGGRELRGLWSAQFWATLVHEVFFVPRGPSISFTSDVPIPDDKILTKTFAQFLIHF